MMNLSPQKVDVVIVGAGPTGLALAIGLAQRGVDFIILDALPEAQNTSRAAVIHAGTLEALRNLKIADRLIEAGIKVQNFRVRERSRVLLRADFGVLRTPTPFALMIPQDESEALMTAQLSALGHQVKRPYRVVGIERQAHGALIRTEDGSQIRSKFVVGADGEKSTVRRLAKISFPGQTYGSFMLADVRMEWPISKDEVTLFFSRDGTLVVAPMSKERYRVVAQSQNAPLNPTVADVQSIIDARGPYAGARVIKVIWGSRFQVHHKLADRFRDGPIVLMGDAAHVHSPAGGQGMNLGLKDAVALAEALERSLRTGRQDTLDDYGETRRAAAQDVLRMTDRLTAVATLRNRSLRVVRNTLIGSAARLPFIRRKVAETLSGTR
ncbi:MAG: monooxygenase [Rhizobiales bacterium]|nr:monooxygenase [Hyphomicrobiales bacterium]|tara:strand:- start:2796 stop:3941 length:1146 start_codon:yes stop_codon:yes gene_type:complete